MASGKVTNTDFCSSKVLPNEELAASLVFVYLMKIGVEKFLYARNIGQTFVIEVFLCNKYWIDSFFMHWILY